MDDFAEVSIAIWSIRSSRYGLIEEKSMEDVVSGARFKEGGSCSPHGGRRPLMCAVDGRQCDNTKTIARPGSAPGLQQRSLIL